MSEKSIVDEIIEALKGKKTLQATNELIEQLKNERALFDRFRNAGLTATTEDLQGRARLRPEGILSKIEKVDLIDLIEKINLIKLIEEITHIGTIDKITTIDNLQHGTLTLLEKIEQLDRLNPSYDRQYCLNAGFETGTLANWANTGCAISGVEKHSGAYSVYGDYPDGIAQLFPAIQMNQIRKFECWAKGQIGDRVTLRLENQSLASRFPMTWAIDYTHTFTATDWQKIDWYANKVTTVDPYFPFVELEVLFLKAGMATAYADDILLSVVHNSMIDYVKEADGRQDLQFKEIQLTFAVAGAQEIIPPSNLNTRIKVYAFYLRKDSATTVYFLEGASGRRFGNDNASGVVQANLFHPIVCAPNNALNIYASGKCGVIGWIQYTVEDTHNVTDRDSGQGYP